MFFREALPALTFSFILQAGMMIIYLDSIIYKLPELMENLYTKEELFSPRLGNSIPFYLKILILITACAIIPLVGSYIAIIRDVPLGLYEKNIKQFFGISIFMLIIGMTFVFKGFQRKTS